MIEARGCKLYFLPPYSPDFNPIELSFSVIKKALKGEYQANGEENIEELGAKLPAIAQNVITPEIALNQFRHCHIEM